MSLTVSRILVPLLFVCLFLSVCLSVCLCVCVSLSLSLSLSPLSPLNTYSSLFLCVFISLYLLNSSFVVFLLYPPPPPPPPAPCTSTLSPGVMKHCSPVADRISTRLSKLPYLIRTLTAVLTQPESIHKRVYSTQPELCPVNLPILPYHHLPDMIPCYDGPNTGPSLAQT